MLAGPKQIFDFLGIQGPKGNLEWLGQANPTIIGKKKRFASIQKRPTHSDGIRMPFSTDHIVRVDLIIAKAPKRLPIDHSRRNFLQNQPRGNFTQRGPVL
jgi:hypothetical protein